MLIEVYWIIVSPLCPQTVIYVHLFSGIKANYESSQRLIFVQLKTLLNVSPEEVLQPMLIPDRIKF